MYRTTKTFHVGLLGPSDFKVVKSRVTKNVTTIPCENAKFMRMIKVALLPFPRGMNV